MSVDIDGTAATSIEGHGSYHSTLSFSSASLTGFEGRGCGGGVEAGVSAIVRRAGEIEDEG